MVILINGMTLDISQVDYVKTTIDPKKGYGFVIHFKRNLNRAPKHVYYGSSKFKLLGKSDKDKASEAFLKIQNALNQYRK